MSFASPLGLLALLAALPIAGAYFLRRRQPPRVVSALFLWRSAQHTAEAGAKFERFSREVSLALELLAVAFAALYLADPRWGVEARAAHLVIVVDGSLSMSANINGQTTADRARERVRALVRQGGSVVVTLVESGVRPTVLAGPRASAARVEEALTSWRPLQPSHDVNASFALARELASSSSQRVVFVTDGPMEAVEVPPTVEVQSVGKPADNFAFISAQRRDENGKALVTVRVANDSAAARDVQVRFAWEDGGVQTQKLSLSEGATGLVRLTLETQTAVKVSLPSDALEADGELTLVSAPQGEVRLGLGQGLDANAQAALTRFVSIAGEVKLGAEPTLVIGPPGTDARVTLGATAPLSSFIGPFFSQKGHPLLDDVQLGGVVWTVGVNPPGKPLLSAGSAVLLSEEEDGRVHLNLDLGRSNIQRTPAWPILMMNVVRSARLSVPGLPKRQLMLGEEVSVVTKPGSSWVLHGPKGQTRPVLAAGLVTLPPLSEPGRWTLEENGKPIDSLEVMALDARESDLRTRGPFNVEAKAGELYLQPVSERPRAWWPLALVLLLLMLDFWLTARGPRRTATQPQSA